MGRSSRESGRGALSSGESPPHEKTQATRMSGITSIDKEVMALISQYHGWIWNSRSIAGGICRNPNLDVVVLFRRGQSHGCRVAANVFSRRVLEG